MTMNWEQAVTWLVNQPDKKELVTACYFDRPVEVALERYYGSEEWREMRELLPSKPGKALDIGAGNGITSFALAKNGWQVDATEPDPSEWVGAGAIRKWSSSYGLPVTVSPAFCESLPYESESFNAVIARQVMHHTRDLTKAFSEIYRVLGPGGIALTTRDHVISSSGQLDAFFNKHPLHNLYGGENAFRKSEYLAAAKAAGFTRIRVLNSLDSEINLAPMTYQSIGTRLQKLRGFPLRIWLGKEVANQSTLGKSVLRLASVLDRRAGRLISLVLQK